MRNLEYSLIFVFDQKFIEFFPQLAIEHFKSILKEQL